MSDIFPGRQALQFEGEGAPRIVEYIPALHGVHWVEFQAAMVVEYVPASHDRHAVAPFVDEYLPAEQIVQIPAVVAPTTLEYDPTLQLAHVLDEVAAVILEYLPAAQLAHLLLMAQPSSTCVPYRIRSSKPNRLVPITPPESLLKTNPK